MNRDLRAENFRFSSLVINIVTSPQFLNRRVLDSRKER